MRAREAFISWNELEQLLDQLESLVTHRASLLARNLLCELVPEFEQQGALVDFVARGR